ncbi:DNA-directed RNA polymerase subunit E'' [Candidatus Pacearchaeota archaeon]|nr:MAG: DNA-directed RNA polymerase subunit E'' [Candidatus Pacearchaeota archaeon]
MAKEKACPNCKLIVTTSKCPRCNTGELKENFKGKLILLRPEESEIAKRLGIKQEGEYAIRL